MKFSNMSNLSQRTIIGTFSTFVMFLSIYLSFDSDFRPFFVLMIAGIIGAALSEFYQIATNKGYFAPKRLAEVCSMLYVFAVYASTLNPFFHHLPEVILFLSLLAIFAYFFRKGSHPIPTIGITLFGLAYITIPLSYFISINYLFPENSSQDGRIWLSYVLIVTKVTDIGAYIFGKLFGRNKITPYISPSKTAEGFTGGFATAIGASMLFCLIAQTLFPHSFALSLAESVFLGALIGIVGQFGDLAESLLKRDGQVKDSNQLPGFGGVLDMFDSLIFTLPLLYFYLRIWT